MLVNASINYDKYHGTRADVQSAYAYAFNASPVNFAPTYPGDFEYGWPHCVLEVCGRFECCS